MLHQPDSIFFGRAYEKLGHVVRDGQHIWNIMNKGKQYTKGDVKIDPAEQRQIGREMEKNIAHLRFNLNKKAMLAKGEKYDRYNREVTLTWLKVGGAKYL